MLDTYGRKYINPLINLISKKMIYYKFSATNITVLALILGVMSAITLYFDNWILSLILLWASGLFDAVDGEVARNTNTQSMIGAQIDIVCDRIVEIMFIWAIALKNENVIYELLLLMSMILISITIFLTTGMISKNKTKKSFYYQSGLMERTEGFIMFSFMIIFKKFLKQTIIIYALLIFVTIIQRMVETIKINSEVKNEKVN